MIASENLLIKKIEIGKKKEEFGVIRVESG
jgi:hypothetical protein